MPELFGGFGSPSTKPRKENEVSAKKIHKIGNNDWTVCRAYPVADVYAEREWFHVDCLGCLKKAPLRFRVSTSESHSRRDIAILGGDPSL